LPGERKSIEPMAARVDLDWLVEVHRALAEDVTADMSFCFDIRGQRLR